MDILTAQFAAHPRMQYTQLRLNPYGLSRHTLVDAVPRGRLLVMVIIDNVLEKEIAKFNHFQALPLEPAGIRMYPLRDHEGRSCQVLALDREMGLVPHDTVIIGHVPDSNLEEIVG